MKDRMVIQKVNTKPWFDFLDFGQGNRQEKFYWLCFAMVLFVKCIYYQYATRLNTLPLFKPVNIFMVVSSLSMILLINAVILLVFNKRRLEALFIVNILITALLAADINFFRYYYSILTLPVILQVNLKLVGSVNESIMSLFKPLDFIILFIDLPAMLWYLLRIRKRGIPRIVFRKRSVAALIAIVFSFTGFIASYNYAFKGVIQHNSNYVTRMMGVLYSHLVSTEDFIKEQVFEENVLSQEELLNIQKSFTSNTKEGSLFKGTAQGKNLVVLQVEALQQFVINRRINGREITPNLNRLLKESTYFDNFYYQVGGGNTSDAELLVNASLHPLKEGSAHTRFPENKFFTLPKLLKDQDYTSYYMHAFRGDFYNRENMYKSLGFDVFCDEDAFVLDESAGWQCDALSDASFFRQSLEKLDKSKPFYNFLITLSSHYPFKYFEDFDFDVGELQGKHLGNYIKAANYADESIGQYIRQLKEQGLYEKTLLVVYGDHSAVPRHLSDELIDFMGVEDNNFEWTKLQKVPLIIHNPDQKGGDVIHTTGGQIDILPTVANLMGLDAPYSMGKDLFNTGFGYAVLRNGSVITDRYVFINDSDTMYDITNGRTIKKGMYEKKLNGFLQKLELSDKIIEYNVFGNSIFE